MSETVNEYTETDLGNVAPNPRGDYSETGEYEYLDLVAYAGGSYICIKEDGTISGTAPTPGKTTEIWQEVSRPGNLTPEYVAMHDDVVNKAASVAEDAAQVAQNAAQIEGMKENVAALQEQTAQDALLTKENRESAAGYASAAETSRMAAEESEENVRALANGFDAHVEEQKTSAQEEITTSRQAAINAIAAQQVSSVNTVKQEGQKAIDKTSADAEATAADRAAVAEKAATVDDQAAQAAQNAAQVAEDKVTVENYMQTAGEAKKQALEAAERLKDSVDLVQKNTVDLLGKAPVIIGSVTSNDGTPVEVNDSAEMPLQGLRLYGKSKQVVTTGKNLCSIKSCQLSTNIVKSKIVSWTKKNRIYFSCDTENVENSNAYIGVNYYDKNRESLGENGAVILCDGTRKEAIFSGSEAGHNGTNIDLTTVEYISVKVGLQSSAVPTSFIDNIMLCDEANQTYEPYTGGKPSPSPEYPQEIVSVGENGSIDVEITGKNLFGGKAFADKIVEIGGTLDEANKTVAILASKIEGKVVYNFPNAQQKQYTIIVRGHNKGGSLDAVNLSVIYDDNTSSILTTFNNGLKIFHTKVGKTATSLKGTWNTGMSVFNYDLFGIFEGVLTEDDFEPYVQSASTISTPNGLPGIPVQSDTTGITYTDSGGQAWIADEIDFSRGKYVQRVWQAEFDGSEDEKWKKVATNYIYIECLPVAMNSRKGVCSQYIVGDDTRGIRTGNGNAMLIIFDDFSDENALSNFKANLSANPFKVMTYLDTPIETDLTQEQLQAYKSLTTFKPTSIISNDANAQMEVEYAADTKAYIDNKLQEIAQAMVASASEAE